MQAALFYDYGQTGPISAVGAAQPRLQRGALGLGLGWQQGHGQLNVSAAWRVSAGNAAPEQGPTIWAQAGWLL